MSRVRSHTGRLLKPEERPGGGEGAPVHHFAAPLQHDVRSHAVPHDGSEAAPHRPSRDLRAVGHDGHALPHFMQPLTHEALHHTGNKSADTLQGNGHHRRHGHDHVSLPRARHNAADRQSDVEHHIDNLHATRGLHDHHVSRVLDVLKKRGGRLLPLLTFDQLRKLANKSKVHTVAEHGILIKQGDHSDCMYIVLKGGMSVVRDFGDPPHKMSRGKEIAFLQAGDVAGDIGFLTGAPRNAFVGAISNSEVLKITRAQMTALQVSDATLQAHLSQPLIKHLPDLNHDEMEVLDTINGHLRNLESYRTSVKTDRRDRWRKKLHAAMEPRHKTHFQDLEEDLEKERDAFIILKELMDEDTASEAFSWELMSSTLEQHPRCATWLPPTEEFGLLHLACMRGLPQICSFLLAHGADAAIPTDKGQTCLHLTLLGDSKYLAKRSDGSLPHERMQILRLLCAHSPPLQRDLQGISPLDLAAHDVPMLLLKELLKQQHAACALEKCRNRGPPVLCSRCKLVKYCCTEHAQLHWATHKIACRAAAGMGSLEDLEEGEGKPCLGVDPAKSETIQDIVSEEAYQRICKQHSLITLRRKGLDFVISDVDEEEKMASMFDHERILHSFWAAWVRIIWIMRCSISMRYRDIHDNIKKQQETEAKIKASKKRIITMSSAVRFFSSLADSKSKAGDAEQAGKNLADAPAKDGGEDGVGELSKGQGAKGGGSKSEGVKGIGRGGKGPTGPGRRGPKLPGLGDGKDEAKRGVKPNFKKLAGLENKGSFQVKKHIVQEEEKAEVIRAVLQHEINDETAEVQQEILKKAGLDDIPQSASMEEGLAHETYCLLQEESLYLEDLPTAKLKALCKHLLPEWNIAKRNIIGFPPLIPPPQSPSNSKTVIPAAHGPGIRSPRSLPVRVGQAAPPPLPVAPFAGDTLGQGSHEVDEDSIVVPRAQEPSEKDQLHLKRRALARDLLGSVKNVHAITSI